MKDLLLSMCKKDSSTNCWNWIGSKTKLGYGRFNHQYAHRLSHICFKGDIPKGMCVCHKCDNPQCVNPDHLFLGTPKDNAQDCVKKGRKVYLKGEKSSSAKLKNKDIPDILDRIKRGDTQISVAKKYHVHPSSISLLVRGKRWNSITGKPATRVY